MGGTELMCDVQNLPPCSECSVVVIALAAPLSSVRLSALGV